MAYTTINKSTDYFNTKLHTGTGSTTTITGVGFQPDMTWWKSRSNAVNHALYDAVRGGSKLLRPNQTNAEETNAAVSAFTSDGVTLTGGDAFTNTSGYTYASWNWKANGSGSANTDGSINSTVSVNTTAGFSIVKYTGTLANATVGHGLGVAPKVIILKNTTTTNNWCVGHGSLGFTKHLALNTTDAVGTSSVRFQDTTPTSTVFSVGAAGETNGSGNSIIAYCFAEKTGYSKFGSYTGNGNADGTFVYTGFKPAWIMLKNTSNTQNWYMYDNKRTPTNFANYHFYADLNNAEAGGSTLGIDILSNGFKIRTSNDGWNGSGENYIYMAFGQSLVGSNNIVANAR